MRFRIFLLFLVALPLACGVDKDASPPPSVPVVATSAADEVVEPDIDRDNLLNMAYGASVVSRTAEMNLETSAAHAIDGTGSTAWISPPGGATQTLVFSFLAPSAVSQLGISTSPVETQAPASALFESSMDGKTWVTAAKLDLKGSDQTLLTDVKPFTARFLRVSVLEKSDYYAHIRSVHAIGREIAPPAPRSLGGCWTINGERATLIQEGARVAGTIATVPPTFIEGGTDGRAARVIWTRGPMWGHGLITMTPDGTRLTALEIHEDIHIQHFAGSWFGERCTNPGAGSLGIAAARILERTGEWSLFGLAFDGNDRLLEEPSRATLDSLAALIDAEPSKRFRLVSYELRDADVARNRARAAARLDRLRSALSSRGTDLERIELVVAGSERKGPAISVAVQRLLASAIVVEKF